MARSTVDSRGPVVAAAAHRSIRRVSWWGRVAMFLVVPVLCAVLLDGTSSVASASGASVATGLPPNLKEFANCPVDNPQVSVCLAASDTGRIRINTTILREERKITLSIGLIANADGTYTTVLPDNGTPALSAPPIPVPGGLLNLPGHHGILAVTATPQLAGIPVFNINNLLSGEGPAITLPTDVRLRNRFLGPVCTVGTVRDPVNLNLTDGTTSPPPPNTPITGALGHLHILYNGDAVQLTGTRLVDNAFAVSGAVGCGVHGDLNATIDFERGLPSAAGTNGVVLAGSSGLAEASLIRKYVK
jgi:hypothetical protein